MYNEVTGKMKCWYLDCENDAEWEIHDSVDEYLETYSCSEHVGKMLNKDRLNYVCKFWG